MRVLIEEWDNTVSEVELHTSKNENGEPIGIMEYLPDHELQKVPIDFLLSLMRDGLQIG